MAKRDLQSLMSGIIGSAPEQPERSGREERQTEVRQPSKQGPGRPRKSMGNDDTRATFIISEALLRKIKFISVMDGCLQKETIAAALNEYINKWEAENGRIPTPKN